MALDPNTSPTARILIVVPTLGRRPRFLAETLQSIRNQSVLADVVIVAPRDAEDVRRHADLYGAQFVPDPGSLAKAINAGVRGRTKNYRYVNWLNDDDLLTPGSLAATSTMLDEHPEAVVAFGSCRYIDEHGRSLWVSNAGLWGPRILTWGPDLIPQPGMLIRTRAWEECGGLDESYHMAFDLDLLLRLKKLGKLLPTGSVVSEFRWHADSLTVDGRPANIAESERAKRAVMGPIARRLCWLWEPLVQIAIKAAVFRLNRRVQKVRRGDPRQFHAEKR